MNEEKPAPSPSEPTPPPSVPPTPPPSLKPPVPPTVAAKPAGAPASPARRQFLFTWLGLAWMAFAAATVAALATVLRFMFPNVLFEPKTTFKAGMPDEYEVGKVDERWKEKFGVWIVRSAQEMYALSTICTHLGCTPNWLDGEQKFKCPCHGSGFFKSGINFEGPAPRPLERFGISLEEGQIVVDKSKKFQQEKGEWSNPASFIAM
jgi:cytochrome b6-f complex iron-sulfur subunit